MFFLYNIIILTCLHLFTRTIRLQNEKNNSVINEGWHDHYPSTPTLSFAATILKKESIYLSEGHLVFSFLLLLDIEFYCSTVHCLTLKIKSQKEHVTSLD